ncbi:hypothetical protein HK099_001243 [Clydaea vesicula]|uniref:RING-type domain-containing protein n=1 Tax=Clydaea vesicula TaxID=447962 RepID=A0AAD5U3W9_9FUNG|nr:hypothetical protein HK099_001243 [Clydaea vesicula]
MGYDVNFFVAEGSQLCICYLCQGVVEEPFECSCSSSFCKRCLDVWLEITEHCPACKNHLSENELTKNFNAETNSFNLLVLCPVSKLNERQHQECQKVMTLENVFDHLTEEDLKLLKLPTVTYTQSQIFAIQNYFNGKNSYEVDDFTSAFEYFELSAIYNNVDSMLELAIMLKKGLGCEINVERSFHFFLKAADLGDSIGENKVAYCYLKGEGVIKDVKKAEQYFEKSAKKGQSDSQVQLALLFLEQNKEKDALQYFKLAAEQGNSTAENELGYCYLKGYGDANAVDSIAECFEFGYGVAKNLEKSLKLYKLALSKGKLKLLK